MTKEQQIKIQRCIDEFYSNRPQVRDELGAALQVLYEAEPVKHGRWIKNEGRSGWHCSCCGKDDLYAYPYTENNERELQDFYCPNCGAKMNEVEE